VKLVDEKHPDPDRLVEWARWALEHADCGEECKYTPPNREQNQALARDIVGLADRCEHFEALSEKLRALVDAEHKLRAAIDDELKRLNAALAGPSDPGELRALLIEVLAVPNRNYHTRTEEYADALLAHPVLGPRLRGER